MQQWVTTFVAPHSTWRSQTAKCCRTAGAQKPPLLRLPKSVSCTSCAQTREKGSVTVLFKKMIGVWNVCFLIYFTALHFKRIKFVKESRSAFLFFSFPSVEKFWKLKRSKSAQTEAPLSHGKHSSWNALPVVPPLNLRLCDITLHHRVTRFATFELI